MKINKYCLTIKKAEKIQDNLYGKYNIVNLIKSPIFGEDGLYTWEVFQELSEDEKDEIWLDIHSDRTPL